MDDNPPEPEQISQDDVQRLLDENKQLKDQYTYDNEWIKFLAKLAENDSLKDIVEFVEKTEWTDRQKAKIMSYSKIMLGRGLSTTYITGMTDYRRLQDDFNLVEAEVIFGMTTFDITPEFNMLMDQIRFHFGVETRRSKGGHFVERLGTQRTEIAHDTINRTPDGFKEKLWKKLTGD